MDGLVLLSLGVIPWLLYALVPRGLKDSPFGIVAIVACGLAVPILLAAR